MSPLREQIEPQLPGVAFEVFLDAVVAIGTDIARERTSEQFEVAASERYRRILRRLGLHPRDPARIADKLAELQASQLIAHTYTPPEHVELLRRLKRSHNLALISNFDHAPTVHALLKRDEIDNLFDAIVVSEEFGRRKPHPAIFLEAVQRSGGHPYSTLHIGDSLADDVGGARAAGIDAAWINPTRDEVPSGVAGPDYVIERLSELPSVLPSR